MDLEPFTVTCTPIEHQDRRTFHTEPRNSPARFSDLRGIRVQRRLVRGKKQKMLFLRRVLRKWLKIKVKKKCESEFIGELPLGWARLAGLLHWSGRQVAHLEFIRK